MEENDQRIEHKAEGATEHSRSSRRHLLVFGVLLVTVIVLTVVFASGLLRFGQSGFAIYVVYVIAGLLSAVLCYGMLGATGSVEGHHTGLSLRIGGSAAILVVIVAGGGIYERYLRTPEEFDLRLAFVSTDGAPVALKGTVRLFLGADAREKALA